MKVAIVGPQECDYEMLERAIEKSKFEITELVHGNDKGFGELVEEWSEEKDIPTKQFPVKWNDFSHPDVNISVNSWGKRYNKNAGKIRDSEMSEYAEALIFIDCGQYGSIASTMKKMDKLVYKYDPHEEMEDDEVGYEF